MADRFVVLDIETTGLSPEKDKITEIAGIKVEGNKIVDRYSQLINPEVPISDKIVSITGITDELVAKEPVINEIFHEFIVFLEGYDIMGHNILFDYSFLKVNAGRLGYKFDKKGIDTLSIAKKLVTDARSRSLTSLIDHFGIKRENAHRAYDDALATYELYNMLKDKYDNESNDAYFEPKPLGYKLKKNEPITYKQEKFLLALVKGHNLKLEKDIKAYTKSEASQAIDNIIREHGRLY